MVHTKVGLHKMLYFRKILHVLIIVFLLWNSMKMLVFDSSTYYLTLDHPTHAQNLLPNEFIDKYTNRQETHGLHHSPETSSNQ